MAAKYLVQLTTANKGLLRSLPARGYDVFASTTRQANGNRFSLRGFLTRAQIDALLPQRIEIDVRGRAEARLHGHKQVATTHLADNMANGYLAVAQIEAAIAHTAKKYPDIASGFSLPHRTHERRSCHGLRIGRSRGRGTKPAILFVGGQHARELVPPDALVFLARSLCGSYREGTDLVLGQKRYDAETIRAVVDNVDLHLFPLANPDGRALVMKKRGGDPDWRKNLSPNNGNGDKGVDLNRNYDFLWDSGLGTSSLYANETYKGPEPLSEPEAQNVVHLLKTIKHLVCLVDIHSFGELVMHPWGHDENQSKFPAFNFREEEFDSYRGKKDDAYKEFMPHADQHIYAAIGSRIRDGIAAVRGRRYTLQQGIDLYATTGGLRDYAYACHLADARAKKIFAFTIEVGPEDARDDGFQPPFADAKEIITEVAAGLLECCLAVIKLRAARKL
ncbi:MAG TPA: M14 family zinc carboxypeptidase [Xanthobacteraceae bacterium]|nr:M14 family zinc carboxypeptidase [Xanthobacteraceae bacterium]